MSAMLLVANDDLNIRYFGGLSQNEVKLVESKKYAAPEVVTEEIFVAKTPEAIDKELVKRNITQSKKGNYAKEFAKDTDGHMFGGLSEGSLNLN